VAVVSSTVSYIWMVPRFSATKIRPSGAKRTAVGLMRPVNAVTSTNPSASVPAAVAAAGTPAIAAASSSATAAPQVRARPGRRPAIMSAPMSTVCSRQRFRRSAGHASTHAEPEPGSGLRMRGCHRTPGHDTAA
jgi:hypothetical protein